MYMTTSKYIIITMDYWLLDKNNKMKLNAACSLKNIPSLAEMNKRVRISIGRVSRYKFINTKSRISSTPFLPLKIGLNLVHIAKKARALVTRKNGVTWQGFNLEERFLSGNDLKNSYRAFLVPGYLR